MAESDGDVDPESVPESLDTVSAHSGDDALAHGVRTEGFYNVSGDHRDLSARIDQSRERVTLRTVGWYSDRRTNNNLVLNNLNFECGHDGYVSVIDIAPRWIGFSPTVTRVNFPSPYFS